MAGELNLEAVEKPRKRYGCRSASIQHSPRTTERETASLDKQNPRKKKKTAVTIVDMMMAEAKMKVLHSKQVSFIVIVVIFVIVTSVVIVGLWAL